ncbi:MAG: hypothetical protein KBD29_00905 [Candidatus Magasanikbacteria bacterium]|nr:hypothetical protein [Candidatus Magasanikbacteria bacterium]
MQKRNILIVGLIIFTALTVGYFWYQSSVNFKSAGPFYGNVSIYVNSVEDTQSKIEELLSSFNAILVVSDNIDSTTQQATLTISLKHMDATQFVGWLKDASTNGVVYGAKSVQSVDQEFSPDAAGEIKINLTDVDLL